jgi:hypothetical protein
MGRNLNQVFARSLISKVQHGELTPQQAEAEAAANSLPPFEKTPDLTDYDPLTESRWTLVMAVAWIAWRDIRRVQESGAEISVGEHFMAVSRVEQTNRRWHQVFVAKRLVLRILERTDN